MYPLTAYRKLLLLKVDYNKTSEESDYACSITHQFLSITFNDPNRAADPIPFNGINVACALA
jgi:hypothetical protein